MNEHGKHINTIIIGAFLAGLLLASFGLYLAFLGGDAATEVSIFGQKITSKNAGVISIFIGSVLILKIIRPVIDIIGRNSEDQGEILSLFQEFQVSNRTPEENAKLIERIANSNNASKKLYLGRAATLPNISLMEADAIELALSDLAAGNSVKNLLQRCREKELPKIIDMMQCSNDPVYVKTVISFKYNRYISRKNSPFYDEINAFLSEAVSHGYFTDKALNLSKDLERKMKFQSKETPYNKLPVESLRDRTIRLTNEGKFNDGLDAANEALMDNMDLISDIEFSFANIKCCAAYGDIEAAFGLLQVLLIKNPSAKNDPEILNVMKFLISHGLTPENLNNMRL